VALLGNLTGSSPLYFNKDPNFYNGVATQSLRFEDGDSPSLSKTFGSAGNRKTWTWSAWVKRGNILGADSGLFGADASGSSNESVIEFDGNDKLKVRIDGSEHRITTQVFRDSSAWYHIVVVFDTTEGTANNRMKIYLNGTQITSFATIANLSQNADATSFNNANIHTIGRWGNTANFYFDGYMAEMNFVDGLALNASYFGETKNGVWIPKEPDVSEYGTNGFRFKFDQVGVGTASTSTIGADSSGKTNHWTSSGIVASDCALPDSPENNFCTFNSIGRRYGQSYVGTFSEGNLKVASGGNATNVFGTMAINQIASQGGVYFEVRMDSLDTSRTYFGVVGDTGINNKNPYSNAGGYTFPIKGMLSRVPRGYFTTDTDASNSVDLTANTAFSDGDVIGIAILSDGKFFAHRNGTYLDNASGNTGNPSTGANPIATIDLTLGDWFPYVGYNSAFSVNFGQDGTFQGNETSGGNQDANGIGDFMFAVPTNCFAICSSNMAEPTIGPNSGTNEQSDDYFTTYLWTGNGSNPRAFTDVGFQADWIWVKKRSGSGTNHHLLADSARGDGKTMLGNELNQETTNDANGTVSDTTTSGGFTVNAGSTGAEMVNDNNDTYVAWLWKANGGTATATISESGDNPAAVVQANPKAGFSIITYTGTGDAGTIAHGLGAVPTWMLIKNRDQNDSWAVYHGGNTSAPATQYLKLDTSAVTADKSGWWDDTAPTSSVFTVHDQHMVNANGENYVAYVFADVEGYSKMGSYISNQNTDGTFIYLGFRPKFVIVKRTNATYYWMMYDSERDTSNVMNTTLFANESNLESASDNIDFVSNGIKLRTTGNSFNGGAGSTFIYMAWAEMPFKYANAR